MSCITIEDNKAKKTVDLYEFESRMTINKLYYRDNIIVVENNDSDGSGYVCFTYVTEHIYQQSMMNRNQTGNHQWTTSYSRGVSEVV